MLIPGLSGAGKTSRVGEFEARGYERLNRDSRGGSLRQLARALDRRLAAGARRLVLDNTYVTRAARYDVVAIAERHGVPVRCVWLDTPLVEAQRNAIARMLTEHGLLLPPEALGRGDDPTRLAPRAQLAQLRQLEPPAPDEGFSAIEVVPFTRRPVDGHTGAGSAVALEALLSGGEAALAAGGAGPRLVFAWLPDGEGPLAAATAGLSVERAACTHPGGPPACWCRPPLPGLLVAFAWHHRIALERLPVVGTTPAHARLAQAAGARFIAISARS